MHKLSVCFQLIIWFEYHIHVKGEVSSQVVNKMAGSGIRLRREIWIWAGLEPG